ncbi:MAG: hypothetical protein DMF61_21630 [Blastocatellia bacterium AA13]|nr:MAG: hypothetical protein DMF61_21630 [Blastocatellia bacterium AA13]
MFIRSSQAGNARGFSVMETTVVVAIAGIVLAFAVPNITNALREYRINAGMRQVADLVHRARMQAIANNTQTSIAVDSANNRAGIIVFNADGTINRTDYIPFPYGVSFGRPTGVTAPLTGVITNKNVSFPAQGTSTTIFQQNFNSRGFPVVAAAGAINVLYFTNGKTFRALTVNSVGEARRWSWDGTTWQISR